MATQTVFDYTLNLDTVADVSIDVSAGQSYSSTNIANAPWQLMIYVDGSQNNGRGGSGAVTDVISCIGAFNQMAAGNHQITIYWYGDSRITLNGSVLRVLVTKR
ncbi:hypothetical protein EWE75_18670 [Sphingomonas populi]|uniref:Uncharacterized protein n=1 Tax=Sphingomonas populi TaxID=2484750 RepID=A0A4Q6XXI6_9SPHN|nr:hypothetical protein [Sphingomonas populi]RZF61216.1 hypothetical protein EWE75_18670 [Sphingomonas populi]